MLLVSNDSCAISRADTLSLPLNTEAPKGHREIFYYLEVRDNYRHVRVRDISDTEIIQKFPYVHSRFPQSIYHSCRNSLMTMTIRITYKPNAKNRKDFTFNHLVFTQVFTFGVIYLFTNRVITHFGSNYLKRSRVRVISHIRK